MTSSYPDLHKNGQTHRSSLTHTLTTSNFPYRLISWREIKKCSPFLNIFKIWPPLWRNCALIWAKGGFFYICRTEFGRTSKFLYRLTRGWGIQNLSQFFNILKIWPLLWRHNAQIVHTEWFEEEDSKIN